MEGYVVTVEKTSPKKPGNPVIVRILSVILIIWIMVYFFPVSERPYQSFFSNDTDVLVIAHQGGEHLAPSNTLVAFETARELGVDVIEFDVHITKDGHLVAIHDSTVDRTTDGAGKVNDLTLEEIQTLDAAHYFQDLEGGYSFREQGITIPSVREIFESFGDIRLNIELKATNDDDRHEEMVEKMWSLIQEFNMEELILIASFDQNIIDHFKEVSEGRTAVSGGRQEVRNFVVLHKFLLRGLYSPSVDAVQIPVEESIFNLADQGLIRGAHRRGMAVHYWTINDEETMRKLIALGADGIITDRPDLLLNVLGRD
ncbi:glycerophosphodiester phosphodiesterase [Alteribacter keqinensis]|uniref:Glycerophosphodiester phosphodiesterase n=1 Tax=Alteribacter keqinensis TaxID=2483800 RepID=A0A3M7TVW4_9BACI|nr:glycerophosphodiester phosphodiesterase [Alteribacter keqinensis]